VAASPVVAASQVVAASMVVNASSVAATSSLSAASAVASASGVKRTRVRRPPPPVVIEKSFPDNILDEPLYLVGAVAFVLGFIGMGFLGVKLFRQWRERKLSAANTSSWQSGGSAHVDEDLDSVGYKEGVKDKLLNIIGKLNILDKLPAKFNFLDNLKQKFNRGKSSESSGTDTVGAFTESTYRGNGNPTPEVSIGHITEPVAPSPDTGDFTSTAKVESPANFQTDDVDPISEADLFLNFGRDAQAEEILKEALQNRPNNYQIHLKLLSIYANRKDTASFADIARLLKDSGDHDIWQQAVVLGYKFDPGNPLYKEAETDKSVNMRTAVVKAKLDSAIDDLKSTQVLATPDVDFDLSTRKKSADGMRQTQEVETSVDFDLGLGSGAAPQHDFDLDIAQSKPQESLMDFEVETPTQSFKDSMLMDFDISSVVPTQQPVSKATPTSSLLEELSFDVPTAAVSKPAPQPAPAKPAPAKPAPSKDDAMEFTLDFKVEEKKPVKSAPAKSDFGEINLSFDSDATIAAKPASDTKSAHGHEVATKFDLVMAYQEMGDENAAREILEEIVAEGDAEQRASALVILDQLA
jgi:FimV-like protein